MTTSASDLNPDFFTTDPTPVPSRRWQWWAVLSTIAVVLLIAIVWIFLHLGSWLVVQDPLQPADVIVVLSGHMPARAMEAARLFGQKAAPQVWVTQPVGPVEELAAMNIPFVGEDFYSQRVLIAMSVPVLAIRILPEPAANTQQEIQEIGKLAREARFRTVLIVTSAPHTRRVHAIWRRLVGDSPRLIVRHPQDDPFNAAHWWRSTSDGLDVVREWLGLANAWAGFPASPSKF